VCARACVRVCLRVCGVGGAGRRKGVAEKRAHYNSERVPELYVQRHGNRHSSFLLHSAP
jgi:hypothetical protein